MKRKSLLNFEASRIFFWIYFSLANRQFAFPTG